MGMYTTVDRVELSPREGATYDEVRGLQARAFNELHDRKIIGYWYGDEQIFFDDVAKKADGFIRLQYEAPEIGYEIVFKDGTWNAYRGKYVFQRDAKPTKI